MSPHMNVSSNDYIDFPKGACSSSRKPRTFTQLLTTAWYLACSGKELLLAAFEMFVRRRLSDKPRFPQLPVANEDEINVLDGRAAQLSELPLERVEAGVVKPLLGARSLLSTVVATAYLAVVMNWVRCHM